MYHRPRYQARLQPWRNGVRKCLMALSLNSTCGVARGNDRVCGGTASIAKRLLVLRDLISAVVLSAALILASASASKLGIGTFT